jgi:transposase-like protein
MDRSQPSGSRKPSPTLAHRVWLEADRPSFRDLKNLLVVRGYSVDESTLSRWKDKNPAWTTQFCEKVQPSGFDKNGCCLDGGER